MWSTNRWAPALVTSALLFAGCGGSSTAQREPTAPPAPAPDPDVGRDHAKRDAALRRQGPTPAPMREDAPEPGPAR